MPTDKTVIGGENCELIGVKYPMSGYYTAEVKFKEEWWNCNDAVIKSVEEKKVLSEVAYILFYKQMYRYFQTKISYNVFG